MTDFETRLQQHDHLAIRTWLRLLTTTTLIEAEIRRRLQDEFGISLPRFDLLAQLDRVPRGLRMSDLSARLMVTKGNVTGLADQLEREGLVERVSGPDRRSVTLRLTDTGRSAFARMASVHEEWVIDLLGVLDAPQQQDLQRLLGLVKARWRGGEA